MTKTALLLCVPYEVTEVDGQIIFDERSGFSGIHAQFTFEWKGCGWYLTDFDHTFDSIYVPHIVAAYQWVEANYTIEWDNGTGKIKAK